MNTFEYNNLAKIDIIAYLKEIPSVLDINSINKMAENILKKLTH